MLVRLLLPVAILGLTACTGFLLLVLISATRFRRKDKPEQQRAEPYPPVTLLKPVCGLEPRLEANLESFFRQDYPQFEIVFGARAESDPALAVVRRLCRRYPAVPVTVVLNRFDPEDRLHGENLEWLTARGGAHYVGGDAEGRAAAYAALAASLRRAPAR